MNVSQLTHTRGIRMAKRQQDELDRRNGYIMQHDPSPENSMHCLNASESQQNQSIAHYRGRVELFADQLHRRAGRGTADTRVGLKLAHRNLSDALTCWIAKEPVDGDGETKAAYESQSETVTPKSAKWRG
jgi:hypothetical protein